MRDLTLEHLRIAYGGKTVLGPLDAVFEPQCLHVLAGPNGAGKSTLLRHLSGVLPKQSGMVRLHGKALDQFSRLEKAKQIAYLAQERELVWPLSVREVVMLGRHPHGTSLETATSVDEQAVDEAMQATAIGDWADRLVTELSGGERARVLLARVLATGATWLLLDEPVAGLDPRQQYLVMALLQDQVRQGRTVVVVLHDLALAARFADRILLLHQGLAVAHGPVQTVLTEHVLADVFGLSARLSADAQGHNLQIHGVMPCNFR